MKRIHSDGAAREQIDNGDHVEVVFDRYIELPVIQIQNTVWVEEPRYLAFTGTEPQRQIRELIGALEDLLKAVQK